MTIQCIIYFHIDEFRDDIICDVISIDACHFLLGRSRKYDQNMMYGCHKNTLMVDKDARKFKLIPLVEDEKYQGK